MQEPDGLMSIGVFARRVGLAPSALRFYDDCGLLAPARVDAATGYRHYAPEQEERAVLVRRLRDAGMPLPDASVVLDGSAEEARAVLRRHAERTRESARAAQEVIGELLGALPGGGDAACARLGGPELARAVRQVAAAVARGADLGRFPALGCVLLELDGHEVRLAATDRYRLAVRTLRASSSTGGPRHALVPSEELNEAVSWLLPRPEIGLELDGRRVLLHDGSQQRALSVRDEVFPSYRMLLDSLPPVHHRIITAREPLAALLRAPSASASGEAVEAVCVQADGEGRLAVGDTELPAVCTGPAVRAHFDPRVLLPALEASVGPDVLLEISAADQPVVVRSADQGSFTTLVMPVHHRKEDRES